MISYALKGRLAIKPNLASGPNKDCMMSSPRCFRHHFRKGAVESVRLESKTFKNFFSMPSPLWDNCSPYQLTKTNTAYWMGLKFCQSGGILMYSLQSDMVTVGGNLTRKWLRKPIWSSFQVWGRTSIEGSMGIPFNNPAWRWIWSANMEDNIDAHVEKEKEANSGELTFFRSHLHKVPVP